MADQAGSMWEKLGGAPHSKMSLRLWLRMLSCTTLVEKRLRLRLGNVFGSTLPRFDILAVLSRHQAGLTMGELSKKLLVSNGNVTGVVSKLVDERMVERTQSPVDKRTYFVRLTPKGSQSFKQMARTHEQWIDEVFTELTNDEIEQLLELLGKVLASAQKSRESHP